jgi:hypothetical protein
MEKLFIVTFSNQDVTDLIQGKIQVYATSGRAAINKVTEMVSVPRGAFFLAMEAKEDDVLKIA